jgi:hypothetical protein
LTGHVPFEAPTVEEVIAAHVDSPVTPPNHLVAEVSQPTSDAILIALAKDPAQRYQTYDDFIMAMTAARSQLLVNQFRGRGGEHQRPWLAADDEPEWRELSGARVRLVVGAFEAFGAHVGVDLGGHQVGVAEQLLHASQIRPASSRWVA